MVYSRQLYPIFPRRLVELQANKSLPGRTFNLQHLLQDVQPSKPATNGFLHSWATEDVHYFPKVCLGSQIYRGGSKQTQAHTQENKGLFLGLTSRLEVAGVVRTGVAQLLFQRVN